MAVFTGRRTRRQIIDQALKKAGNTKILAEAREELSRILENLYVQHEWPWLYTETSLTLTASTALPTNFLKPDSAADTALRGTAVDGTADDWPILLVTPQEWRRRAIPRDETSERPDMAVVDYATSVLKPWPIPSTSVTALLVYKFLPSEVPAGTAGEITTYDANIPTFPYHGYLVDAVEAWALEYEHDPRAGMAFMKLKDSLGLILGTALPPDSNRAASLELDPAIFLTPVDVNTE